MAGVTVDSPTVWPSEAARGKLRPTAYGSIRSTKNNVHANRFSENANNARERRRHVLLLSGNAIPEEENGFDGRVLIILCRQN